MRILLCAATALELEPIRKALKVLPDRLEIDYLETGVGMVATAFTLGKCFAQQQFDLAINVGIAGAFDRTLQLGETVEVESDQFSELGAEEGSRLLNLKQMGLDYPEFYSQNGELKARHQFTHDLKKVKGITVNTVHGRSTSIEKIIQELNPQVESMEGAAFFHACLSQGLNCIQLRGLSNYVEKRDRSQWNIPLALDNLALNLKKHLANYEA